MPEYKVRYKGDTASLAVSLIRTFKRDDPDMVNGPEMSISSGQKDQIRNRVHNAFADLGPDVLALSMLRSHGPVFLIARTKENRYFDLAPHGSYHVQIGREVEIAAIKAESKGAAA